LVTSQALGQCSGRAWARAEPLLLVEVRQVRMAEQPDSPVIALQRILNQLPGNLLPSAAFSHP